MRRILMIGAMLVTGPVVAQEQAWSSEQAGKHLEAMETIVGVLCPYEDRFKKAECLDDLPNHSYVFAACGTAFTEAPDQYACYLLAREVWTNEAMTKLRPDLSETD